MLIADIRYHRRFYLKCPPRTSLDKALQSSAMSRKDGRGLHGQMLSVVAWQGERRRSIFCEQAIGDNGGRIIWSN